MSKSFNDAHRLIRMRARPKILLAKNYEEAKKYFDTYNSYVGSYPVTTPDIDRKVTDKCKWLLSTSLQEFVRECRRLIFLPDANCNH